MMTPAQLSLLIAAFTLSLSAMAFVVRISMGWQRVKSDVQYIRRDLDQILRLYKLMPAEERDRNRRR